jgi:hypothetical protein
MTRSVVSVALVLGGLLVACNSTPTAPSAPTPPSLPPTSPPALRGTVFENTSVGRRPIAGAHVFVVDLDDGPYGDYPWYVVDSDAGGHFTMASLPSGRPVKLTAYVGSTNPRLNDSGLSQVCAAHPTPGVDAAAEIDLFSPEAIPRTLRSPILRGVIVEGSPSRPAADLAVIYSSNGHDGADVYTRTDADGRFAFCGLPEGSGHVLPFCSRDRAPSPGATHAVEIRGDTTLNITCP